MASVIELPPLRILPYHIYTPTFNMAADEYLMNLPQPCLRLYGWTPPTLSFGRGVTKLDELDPDVYSKYGIGGVKRLTGGKTVFHHLEITYSLTVSTQDFPCPILETYLEISQAFALGFSRIGIEIEMKKEKEQTSSTTICFKEISSYEITVDNKKLVGSAQYRNRDKVLQHGSILLDADWELWNKIWKFKKEDSTLRNRVTTLKDCLGYLPSIEKLERIIGEEFSNYFHTKSLIQDFSPEEKKEISILESRYHWPEFYQFHHHFNNLSYIYF